MATRDLQILGTTIRPDGSGDVWPASVKTELTLSNALGNEGCFVMPAAATISADTGVHGSFTVPRDFVDTPVLTIHGILDGAPTTLVIAFGVQMAPTADDEAYDVALGTQSIASASSVSQVDKDRYVETISLGDTFAALDEVTFFFFIDDSVHTYTGKFLLTSLFFTYNDA